MDNVKDIWFRIHNAHESICGVRVRVITRRNQPSRLVSYNHFHHFNIALEDLGFKGLEEEVVAVLVLRRTVRKSDWKRLS